jgi:hypothetical protein
MNNRKWLGVAVLVLVLGAIAVIFGWNLLPAREVADAKGTYAPWLGTWILIWIVVAMTVTLAWYLFAVGTGKIRE